MCLQAVYIAFVVSLVSCNATPNYDFTKNETINLGNLIRENSFKFSDTYSTLHLMSGNDFTLFHRTVVYLGNLGVYSFDIDQQIVRPILIGFKEGNGRIDYTSPGITSDGQLFLFRHDSEDSTLGIKRDLIRLESKNWQL